MFPLIVTVLIGFALSTFLLGLVCRGFFTWTGALPTRQFHQTHRGAIPRIGGLAFAVPFAVFYACSLAMPSLLSLNPAGHVVALASLAMFVLGLWDDFRVLGAKRKLAWQLIIASAAWLFGLRIEIFGDPFTGRVVELGILGAPVTVLWIVALTNLINLIDGIDGLAGGLGLMLMCLLAYTTSTTEAAFQLLGIGVVIGALLGFLRLNFPPATVHMGDSGAYFLGCLIAGLSVHGANKGTVFGAMIAPLFALAVPITDTCLTISRRALKGLPVFRPDRKHLHHRLIDSGLTKRSALLVLYVMSGIFLLMAFFVFVTQGRYVGILVGVAFLGVLIAARSFSFSREWLTPVKVIRESLAMRQHTRYALTLSHWLDMEAAWAPSVPSLWADFCFLAAKLRFSRVTLQFQDGSEFHQVLSDTQPTGECKLVSNDCEIHFEDLRKIHFEAWSGNMPPRLFELLCELASEAWVKALTKWRLSHETDASLSANPFNLAAKLAISREAATLLGESQRQKQADAVA